jgi:hypothetical protein
VNFAVAGGDGWRPDNSFAVTWTDPGGQVSPIAAAHYAICASDGTSCGPQHDVAGDPSHIDGISVPSSGEWLLKVWLEDGAGNVDATHAATATLRFGTPPSNSPPSGPPDQGSPTGPGDFPAELPQTVTDFQPPALITALQSPALHLTSARYARGRLVIRGRTSRSAAGSLTLRFRYGSRVVSRTRRVGGGAFRVVLTLRHPPRRVSARFGPNAFFRAQTQIVRVR